MFARAFAAAALALLIGGDAARLGWGAVDLRHFLFPYLWLFTLIEAWRGKRRVDDRAAFILGAAMASIYGGIYAKDYQYGLHPFGVDFLGALCGAFDWGMTVVLALHIADRFFPRRREPPQQAGAGIAVFLVAGIGACAVVYGLKSYFSFYRAERMLGSFWLVADLCFAYAAVVLARRAWNRPTENEEDEADRGIWMLAAFAVWLPGARFVARAASTAGLPDALLYLFVIAWSAAASFLFWRLWRERGYVESRPVSGSRSALLAALWRFAGTAILVVALGADLNDEKTAGIFSAAIDWPSRALFAWALLTSRLNV